ncbi:hypothetical protein [Paenibacillus arenilitoris]|uniref:Uncharacterized protein n=1 Tax=Paenibacillus arenilitoris TaxID=2772299 RepID=A0A927CPJ9_9BACL|nr:hypothetical protein [Paenibacillus arenilitoris]MBD2869916.1 hypothetical protein [Paenibacillus arenilitoris]
MSDIAQKVPFGFEPEADIRKGTIIFYDSFEHISGRELDMAASITRERSFAKLVLYPLHEQTVKRMSKEPVSALYKREDKLFEWKKEQGGADIVIERLEAKRKKYTPIDAALRHLTESYPLPAFLLLTGETANQFASYSSFEEWIGKIRLILLEEPNPLHPRLERNRHRWESVT